MVEAESRLQEQFELQNVCVCVCSVCFLKDHFSTWLFRPSLANFTIQNAFFVVFLRPKKNHGSKNCSSPKTLHCEVENPTIFWAVVYLLKDGCASTCPLAKI